MSKPSPQSDNGIILIICLAIVSIACIGIIALTWFFIYQYGWAAFSVVVGSLVILWLLFESVSVSSDYIGLGGLVLYILSIWFFFGWTPLLILITGFGLFALKEWLVYNPNAHAGGFSFTLIMAVLICYLFGWGPLLFFLGIVVFFIFYILCFDTP
jgi:hypothetical protein